MSASHPSPDRPRLNSWKEIAAFFGRDERTVNRWEKDRGLPVYRLPGSKGRVYAYLDELSAWPANHRNDGPLPPTEKALAYERARLVLMPGGVKESGSFEEIGPSTGPASSRSWTFGGRIGWIASLGLAALASCVLFLGGAVPRTVESAPPHSTVRPNASGSRALASPAPDPKAEQLYLKGRYYWNKRTGLDLATALDYFMQAIVHDPNYSQAYVGMSDCYNLMPEYSSMPASEAYPRALAAAQKAVELDQRSSQAHASLGYVMFFGVWNLDNGERELRRAIDLNPNNPESHHWHANALLALRRIPEALEEVERAQVLDPSSPSILADKGNILWQTGLRDEAIKLVSQVEKREPEFRAPHYYLKYMYLRRQDYPNFLSEQRRDASLVHDGSSLAIATAAEKGYAAAGGPGMLAAIFQAQQRLHVRHSVSAFELAQSASMLGKKSEALTYLKAAYDQRETSLLFIESYPEFENLRDDPAYRELIDLLKLRVQR